MKTFLSVPITLFDFTNSYFNAQLSQKDKEELLDEYKALPAFDDVEEGLLRAKNAGYRMFAFSNGSADAAETALKNAGIRDYFIGVVSVDDEIIQTQSRCIYSHFLRRADALGANVWLISSNPFDVIGAISFGMRAAWVKRSPDGFVFWIRGESNQH